MKRIAPWKLASLLLALASWSCAHPLTEIVLVVDTNIPIPQGIDSIRIQASGTMAGGFDQNVPISGTGAVSLPLTLALVHAADESQLDVNVTVTGLEAGSAVVTRTVHTQFVLDESLVLPVLLEGDCVGVSCGAGETCIGGGCQSDEVPSSSLAVFTGTAPPVDGAARDATLDVSSTDALSCESGCDTGADVVDTHHTDAMDTPHNDATQGSDVRIDVLDARIDSAVDTTMDTLGDARSEPDVPAPEAMVCALPDGGAADLTTDPNNCGSCGNVCSFANATPTCTHGQCGFQCLGGYADCNGLASDGCEVDLQTTVSACGTCTTVCSLPHATPTCTAGVCAIQSCASGYADCDGMAANGCETPTNTLTNCGGCGTACAPAHATGTCSTGTCAIASCATGYADCNNHASDGCEVDVLTHTSNCGHCAHACTAGACSSGLCPGQDIVQLASNGRHVAARYASGQIDCWGTNGSGESAADPNVTTMVLSPNPSGVTNGDAVSMGISFTCAHLTTGATECWGLNTSGQLGTGMTSTDSPTPVAVTGLMGPPIIGSGANHTCAVNSAGALMCWGLNGSGQLGVTGTSAHSTPTTVTTAPANITEISGGIVHTCVATSGGAVWCWGANDRGQCGTGTASAVPVAPTQVTGPTGVTSISSGAYYTCVVDSAHALWCWGGNETGQFGNGTTSQTNPVPMMSGIGSVASVDAVGTMTCVRLLNGSIECFGTNMNQALTLGTNVPNSDVPVAISVPQQPVLQQVIAGADFGCALDPYSFVYCWGGNGNGELGNGTMNQSRYPVQVPTLP